jgi:hypothetical protein
MKNYVQKDSYFRLQGFPLDTEDRQQQYIQITQSDE